jgi:hypothetical protein
MRLNDFLSFSAHNQDGTVGKMDHRIGDTAHIRSKDGMVKCQRKAL